VAAGTSGKQSVADRINSTGRTEQKMKETIGGLVVIALGVGIAFLGSLPHVRATHDWRVFPIVMYGSWIAGALVLAVGLLGCVAGAWVRPKRLRPGSGRNVKK